VSRALVSTRARASKTPVQRKVLAELVKLRREQLLAERSVKELQHETKMMRTAFRVRARNR
jgi:hypothetical protein